MASIKLSRFVTARLVLALFSGAPFPCPVCDTNGQLIPSDERPPAERETHQSSSLILPTRTQTAMLFPLSPPKHPRSAGLITLANPNPGCPPQGKRGLHSCLQYIASACDTAAYAAVSHMQPSMWKSKQKGRRVDSSLKSGELRICIIRWQGSGEWSRILEDYSPIRIFMWSVNRHHEVWSYFFQGFVLAPFKYRKVEN